MVAPGTNGAVLTGLCLDPHDLFVSKVAAGREKDIKFVRTMIEHRMVDRDRVLKLAAAVPNPLDDLHRSRRIVKRIEGLYATVPAHQLTHINVANGKYTGNIVGMSEEALQQMTADDEIIFHLTKIDHLPEPGDLCTIQYQGGRGHVLIHRKPDTEAPPSLPLL